MEKQINSILRITQFFLPLLDSIVYDSAAKLPSGLLSGNVNNLGNFDQCLAVRSPPDDTAAAAASTVRGQYCLAYLQPNVPSVVDRPRLRQLHDLVQSHSAFQSDFNDVSTYFRKRIYIYIEYIYCVPYGFPE